MRVMTVAGARPQFIKEAMVARELRKKHDEILVHTGQHYDYNMSEKFFDQLNIPKPDYNLGISGGTHGHMTGRMLMGIEDVMVKEKPDMVLLYGDTNSTLAAALAASKLHIPIAHVESGTRTHEKRNPEEINRICIDHVSDLLFCCTENDYRELRREGLSNLAIVVGDPMYDAFMEYSTRMKTNEITLQTIDGTNTDIPDDYYYMTCHREENTDDDKLIEICAAMNELEYKTIYPVHPRNRDRIECIRKKGKYDSIIFVDPIGYLESCSLVLNARKVITDSGGIQREAFFAKKQCVTVLNHVTWEATMVGERNQLARPERKDILEKLSVDQIVDDDYQPFGDGHASERIVSGLDSIYKSKDKM